MSRVRSQIFPPFPADSVVESGHCDAEVYIDTISSVVAPSTCCAILARGPLPSCFMGLQLTHVPVYCANVDVANVGDCIARIEARHHTTTTSRRELRTRNEIWKERVAKQLMGGSGVFWFCLSRDFAHTRAARHCDWPETSPVDSCCNMLRQMCAPVMHGGSHDCLQSFSLLHFPHPLPFPRPLSFLDSSLRQLQCIYDSGLG